MYRSRERVRRLAALLLLAVGVELLVASGYGLLEVLESEFGVYRVLTGSMEPFVPTGSIVFVRKVHTATDYSLGEVLLYTPGGRGEVGLLHRLIGYTGDGMLLIKGDAVERVEVVDKRWVKGVMVWGLPWGAYAAPVAASIAAAVAAALLYSSLEKARRSARVAG